MRAHIVLAHPEPASFNGRLAGLTEATLAARGWQTDLTDLYAAGFDPREGPAQYRPGPGGTRFDALDAQRAASAAGTLSAEVQAEIDRIRAADLLVVHFPLWWWGMPAVLKGWIDRVFAHGALHSSQRRFDTGTCVGKAMIACVTTGAGAEALGHDGFEGDIRLHVWPLLFPYRYLGFDVLEPEVLHGVAGGPEAARDGAGTTLRDTHAARWQAALAGVETRPRFPFNRDDDFDATGRLHAEAPSHSPFVRHRPGWD